MAKKKRKLTTKQEQLKHRFLQYTAIGGMGLSVATPFAIMAGINFKEWFMVSDGYKVGIGATIAAVVVGFALFLVTRKKEKELPVTNGWITFIVIWLCVGGLFELFSEIAHEIFVMMMWTALGLVSAFGLDQYSKSEKKKADAYKEAREEAHKDDIKEKAKREVEEETDYD